MLQFLNPSLCANTERVMNDDISPCQNAATQACGSCKLVQYCSKQCQKMHWRDHKSVCKSVMMNKQFKPAWILEERLPSFVADNELANCFGVNQYLWGNMPALDVLNMKNNEGEHDIHRDISLLFAASGDIRNIVKSVLGLSDGYDGRCTVVMNDMNFVIVARNIILLMTAMTLEPDVAVPIIIHVWYSALIPERMLAVLQECILPHIDHVCAKIADRTSSSLQAKTFTFGSRSLRITLLREQWFKLRHFFAVPEGLAAEDAQRVRKAVMLAPERVDYLHRALISQQPNMRMATLRFREDGILLPYGSSRREFDSPNPTFFQDPKTWPMKDDADPHSGWAFGEYVKHAPVAKHDMNGSLFFYLQKLLLQFCTLTHDVQIEFHIHNVDARSLYEYLDQPAKCKLRFDRIELSNICDRGYIGPKHSMRLISHLLKPKEQNPKATALMLFLNAVGEVYHEDAELGKKRVQESMKLIQKFNPMTPVSMMAVMRGEQTMMSHPGWIRLSSCYTMFGDFDKAFESFVKDVDLDRKARQFGVSAKRKHTIVDRWPLRITEESTQEDFDLLCGSNHTGTERYMEFQRI